MKILFGGHELLLLSSGALFWPERRMLVASDLHLEKGSHFARRGYFLPPYDTHKTLEGLLSVCKDTNCEKLILLGDCFHDAQGYERLGPEDRALFSLLRAYDPVWIYGNHDGDFVPEGFEPGNAVEFHGLVFRHQATQGEKNEISGHYHPKAEIGSPKKPLSCRCFIEDGFKLVMPAFGSYAGGLSIADPVVHGLFAAHPRIYLLGQEKVYQAVL